MKIKIFLITIIALLKLIPALAQWEQVFQVPNSGFVGRIFSDEYNVMASTDSGLCFSKDTGHTWKLADTSEGMKSVEKFIKFNNSIYATSILRGVYRSDDHGETWRNLDPGGYSHFSDIMQCGNALIAVGVIDLIHISYDSGRTWSSASKGLPANGMSNGGLTNAFAFGGKIYAFYDFDIVYMSSDTAKSWHYFGSGYYSNSTTMGGNIYLVDNYYMKIYVSSDTGKNWRRCFPNTNPNKYINDIASDSSVLAAAIDKNGVIMSVDSGKNWVYINQGLTILDASSITIGKDYIYCSIGDRSIFRRPLRDAIISGIEKTSGAFCEQFNVNVYPNPLNQYTTFHFGRALEHGKIVVYNLTGKEIANCSNINGSSFQLQCSNLAGGTYIYLLMEGAKKLAGGKLQVK